jgi:hypothetical protein
MVGDDVSDDGGEYDDGGDDENWEKQGGTAATSHGIKIRETRARPDSAIYTEIIKTPKVSGHVALGPLVDG